VIVAERKPIDEVTSSLKGCSNILVVGCSTCVAECAVGGEEEVETLASLLRIAMGTEARPVRVRTKTLERQCEWEFVEELAEILPGTDAVLSMACGIGVQALCERFPEVPIYPGVNTTSLCLREDQGLWSARCAACGDCVLGETFGVCPVARCAKSMLNGPCGGTRKDGKCEVDENVDCAWNLIVERAAARGQLESLMKVRPTKDWSNSGHGGPKRIVREDLRP
jgi:ferredoxin